MNWKKREYKKKERVDLMYKDITYNEGVRWEKEREGEKESKMRERKIWEREKDERKIREIE